jgi:hypothetical protein
LHCCPAETLMPDLTTYRTVDDVFDTNPLCDCISAEQCCPNETWVENPLCDPCD